MGYEIVYKDTDKKELKLERIASKYKKSKNKKAYRLKLKYNEHLADIDIVYTFDQIKYIEIFTSKGASLKVGVDPDNGYSSVSKIDVRQKSYMPIVGFETTFSKDGLKEIFVYRSPVRFSKKRKRKALTVDEINSLKAAPNLDSLKKAQKNIELIRNVTLKSIRQLKALRTFQSLAQRPDSVEPPQNPSLTALEQPATIKEEKEDNYIEDQEFGIEHDADEAEELEKESAGKRSLHKRISASFLFINLFKRKESNNSFAKESTSRENSPDGTPSRRKKSSAILSLLKLQSLRRIMGVSGSPRTALNSPNITKFPINANETSCPGKSAKVFPNGYNENHDNVASNFRHQNRAIKKRVTIEEALQNLDSFGEEEEKTRNENKHFTGYIDPINISKEKEMTEDRPDWLKVKRLNLFKNNQFKADQDSHSEDDSMESSTSSEENSKDFSNTVKNYDIASNILSFHKQNNQNQQQTKLKLILDPKVHDINILPGQRIVGESESVKDHSRSSSRNNSIGNNKDGIRESKSSPNKMKISTFENGSSNYSSPNKIVLNPTSLESSAKRKPLPSNLTQSKHRDSAIFKILHNLSDKKIDHQEEQQQDNSKIPIRRSTGGKPRKSILH